MVGERALALAFVLFGVVDLIGAIEFPDTMLLIVLVQPPKWISWLIAIILPMICIVFGLTLFFRKKIGGIVLFIVSIIYAAMHFWAVIEYAYLDYPLRDGIPFTIGSIELKIVGGLLVFLTASVYLYLRLRPRKGTVDRGV